MYSRDEATAASVVAATGVATTDTKHRGRAATAPVKGAGDGAVVEVTPDALAVELHRITTVYDAASEEDYAECTAGLERNRPELPPPGPGCTRFTRDLDGPWVQEVCGPSPGPLD